MFGFKGNLFEPITSWCRNHGLFDIIVTNPPYIATSVISSLDKEVRNEPLLALDGGTDGLDLIRRIISESVFYLNHNGFLLMEIGYDQGLTVKDLFCSNSLKDVEIIKDLASLDRVVKGRF